MMQRIIQGVSRSACATGGHGLDKKKMNVLALLGYLGRPGYGVSVSSSASGEHEALREPVTSHYCI